MLQINSTQLLIKTRLAFQSDECSTDATLESATHILQLITRKGDQLKQETVRYPSIFYKKDPDQNGTS